jgi:hypothetical protein
MKPNTMNGPGTGLPGEQGEYADGPTQGLHDIKIGHPVVRQLARGSLRYNDALTHWVRH